MPSAAKKTARSVRGEDAPELRDPELRDPGPGGPESARAAMVGSESTDTMASREMMRRRVVTVTSWSSRHGVVPGEWSQNVRPPGPALNARSASPGTPD
jgi:hypothetical protein